MKKQELIEAFINNHEETVHYINTLTDELFVFNVPQKWSAGQQLKHILLTLTPFPGVLSSKPFILEKFGKINRPTWSYETVLENYSKTSLKAPERFLPENDITPDQKEQIISEINETLALTKNLLEQYSEEELDSLSLPHPLLGLLTIREMFYLMSYHPIHHLKQIKNILRSYPGYISE